MSRDQGSSSTSSSRSYGRQENVSLRDRDRDSKENGYIRSKDRRDDYNNSPISPNSVPTSARSGYRSAVDKHRSNGRSKTKKESSTREILRLMLDDARDKEALAVIQRTSEQLQEESRRAQDAERRLAEMTERWKVVNQARMSAQTEFARVTEELRLYKMQLETAQTQINRANDIIAQTDREKAVAEAEAEKNKRLADRLQEKEREQAAREVGRAEGRREGVREGRAQGYKEGLEEAFERARREAMRRLDDYLVRNGLNGGPDEYFDDDEYGPDDLEDYPPDSRPPDPRMTMPDPRIPQRRDPHIDMPDPQVPQQQLRPDPRTQQPMMPQSSIDRRLQAQAQSLSTGGRGAFRMPEPEASTSRRGNNSQRPQISNSFFARLRGRGNANGTRSIDQNVEMNPTAPDVASILNEPPVRTVATPLPSSSIPQPGYREASPPNFPEPNFNPDPRDVPPISVHNRQPSPRHSRIDIPPEGYIPVVGPDGMIGIPPPHELSMPPPTPGRNSPVLGESSSIYNAPPPPPKSPRVRDYGYDDLQMPSRSPRHHHSRSVDSLSTTTSAYSILNPPGRNQSMPGGPRLTAIPENDHRQPSPVIPDGAMPRPASRTSMRSLRPADPGALGINGVYVNNTPSTVDNRFEDNRRRIAEELRNPDIVAGERRESMAFSSPRSARSGYPYGGPQRPSNITVPSPLAGPSYGNDSLYTRPRVNSGASEAGFPADVRSLRGGGSIGGSSGYGRGSRSVGGSQVGDNAIPDINIEPPSRSDSVQSRPSMLHGNAMSSPAMPSPSVPSFGVGTNNSARGMPEPTIPTLGGAAPPAMPTPTIPSFEGVPVPPPKIPSPSIPSFGDRPAANGAPQMPMPSVPNFSSNNAPSPGLGAAPGMPVPIVTPIGSANTAPAMPAPEVPHFGASPSAPAMPLPTVPTFQTATTVNTISPRMPNASIPNFATSQNPSVVNSVSGMPLPSVPTFDTQAGSAFGSAIVGAGGALGLGSGAPMMPTPGIPSFGSAPSVPERPHSRNIGGHSMPNASVPDLGTNSALGLHSRSPSMPVASVPSLGGSHSPNLHHSGDLPPPGFVPQGVISTPSRSASPGPPIGFVPHAVFPSSHAVSPLAPGGGPTVSSMPMGMGMPSPSVPPVGFAGTARTNSSKASGGGPPLGFIATGVISPAALPSVTPLQVNEPLPPGFVPHSVSATPRVATLPDVINISIESPTPQRGLSRNASPNLSGALPVFPRSMSSQNYNRTPSRGAGGWDNDNWDDSSSSGTSRTGSAMGRPFVMPMPSLSRPVSPRTQGVDPLPVRMPSFGTHSREPSPRIPVMSSLPGGGGSFNFSTSPNAAAMPLPRSVPASGFAGTASSSSGVYGDTLGPMTTLRRPRSPSVLHQDEEPFIPPMPVPGNGLPLARSRTYSARSIYKQNEDSPELAYDGASRSPGNPAMGLSRSMSMSDRSPRMANMTFPSPGLPVAGMPGQGGPGLPPQPLSSPYSRRLSLSVAGAPEALGASPRGALRGLSASSGPVFPAYPTHSRAASPAFTSYSTASNIRRAKLPSSANSSPRESRTYPRTPHYRSNALSPQEESAGYGGESISRPSSRAGGASQPMDRPMSHYMYQAPPSPTLHRSASKVSIGSNKSYSRFDANSYVDPAVLASGQSTLLRKGSRGSGLGGSGQDNFGIW